MIAYLYLLSESLQYNGTDSEEDVLNKLNAFVNDLKYINKYKEENQIIVNLNIYSINISKTKKLFASANQLEREGKNLLYNILTNSSNCTDLKLEAIKEKCINHNQDECSAILAFNQVADVHEDVVIVYDKQSWFGLRRRFLGKYPKNADYFINECQKYFENLFFHKNNRESIVDYLDNFSSKIVKYLSDLNDDFKPFYERNKNTSNINNLLKRFSIEHNHDDDASLQGNHEKKELLTFDYAQNEVCCEPHLKISKSDKYPQDPKNNYAVRIYFHFGYENIENGRILIGSIGPHVK